MEYKPSQFQHILPNDNQPNDCSPKDPGPQFLGILLNAPEKIRFDVNEPIQLFPICGYYQLSALSLRNSKPMQISVLCPGQESALTGFVVYPDESPEAPNPQERIVPDSELKDIVNGSYFNLNILEFIQVPFVTGEYQIWIEYGAKKSKVASVHLEIDIK